MPQTSRKHSKSPKQRKNASHTYHFSLILKSTNNLTEKEREYRTKIAGYQLSVLALLGRAFDSFKTEKTTKYRGNITFSMNATTSNVELYRALYYYLITVHDYPGSILRIKDIEFV